MFLKYFLLTMKDPNEFLAEEMGILNMFTTSSTLSLTLRTQISVFLFDLEEN